jgi:hypothetical protein
MKGNKHIETPDGEIFDIVRDGGTYFIWADLEDGGSEMMMLGHKDNIDGFPSEEEAMEWLRKHYPNIEIKEE